MQITITIPTFRKLIGCWRALALFAAALGFALFAASDSAQGASNSVTSPDSAGDTGYFSSLALDAEGFPVISYMDAAPLGITVMHCNDANCSGGDESIQTVDAAAFQLQQYTSLALDASGFPVVAYHDNDNDELKVLHCNDANCAGGNESIVTFDPILTDDGHASLALDAAGFPVISVAGEDFFGTPGLRIIHCNDANCAGNDDPNTFPDSPGIARFTSLELDSAGNPVVSYSGSGNIKVLHCNDPICVGNDESIATLFTGSTSSLELDASGFPVISYYDATNGDVTVMHCNDANCAGGGEIITTPDTAGDVGAYTSLALDSSGFPVVSYQDVTNGDLKVMRCNDANCFGGNETVTSPDSAGTVGTFGSLALDAAGKPVVAYLDETNIDLKVLHCGTPACNGVDPNPSVQEIRIGSLTAGWPAGPMGGGCYTIDPLSADATFVVCDNEVGAGVDSSNACTKDGNAACTDADPAMGSITVAVLAGSYNVTTNSAPGHMPDAHLKPCNPAAGVDAKCSFTHTPLTRPWFPWDVSGDGAVAGADFFQLLGHFGQVK